MSNWAEIDKDNIVLRVTVGDNNDPAGDEGYSWLIENLGGTWVKTSFNTHGGVHSNGGLPLRKNFAGTGYTYDETRDAFIAPKPESYPSKGFSGKTVNWYLNEDTCLWEAKTE